MPEGRIVQQNSFVSKVTVLTGVKIIGGTAEQLMGIKS
jgi:hypothetical protein